MPSDYSYPSRDITGTPLQGPPPPGFDCARDAQNRFLYGSAWTDQQEMLSITYLYYVQNIPAAYCTVLMSSIILGTREKPRSIPYKQIAALKVAQLGVDRRFQGGGLGRRVVGDMVGLAREEAADVGCRYVVLDAKPDLVSWYERQGFRINRRMQKDRVEAAAGTGQPQELAVSMRFDLLS